MALYDPFGVAVPLNFDITHTLEREVGQCATCNNSTGTPKEKMMPHEAPPIHWSTVATDLFQLGSHHYIIVADMCSKMPFVRHLPSLTTSSVISFFKSIFPYMASLLKSCLTMVPNRKSKRIQNFCMWLKIRSCDREPYFAQSKNFIKQMVGDLKIVLKKVKDSRIDPHLDALS